MEKSSGSARDPIGPPLDLACIAYLGTSGISCSVATWPFSTRPKTRLPRPLPAGYWPVLAATVVAYALAVHLLKRWLLRQGWIT